MYVFYCIGALLKCHMCSYNHTPAADNLPGPAQIIIQLDHVCVYTERKEPAHTIILIAINEVQCSAHNLCSTSECINGVYIHTTWGSPILQLHVHTAQNGSLSAISQIPGCWYRIARYDIPYSVTVPLPTYVSIYLLTVAVNPLQTVM